MQIRFSFLSMTTSARKTLKTLEALYIFLRWKQMIHFFFFLADWVCRDILDTAEVQIRNAAGASSGMRDLKEEESYEKLRIIN